MPAINKINVNCRSAPPERRTCSLHPLRSIGLTDKCFWWGKGGNVFSSQYLSLLCCHIHPILFPMRKENRVLLPAPVLRPCKNCHVLERWKSIKNSNIWWQTIAFFDTHFLIKEALYINIWIFSSFNLLWYSVFKYILLEIPPSHELYFSWFWLIITSGGSETTGTSDD